MNETNNMGSGPNYDKYVVDNSATMGEGRVEPAPGGKMGSGQSSFGVVGDYEKSANCDPTRFTEDDKVAYDNLTKGEAAEIDETDESQGGIY